MDDKENFKFRVNLLDSNNYFSWSNDMEIILRGRGLWKFVENKENIDEGENSEQKRDLALAYILTSVSNLCKPAIRKARCPTEAWNKLRTMFQAVSEASIDAKLTKLQNIQMKKGEKVIEYSNRVEELVSELESAGHPTSVVEKKRALLRGLPTTFDITAETCMGGDFDYDESVAKLIVRETRIIQVDENCETALAMKQGKKCFKCGKQGHIAKNCWKNKEKRRCFKCNKVGHLARDCREEIQENNNGESAMVVVQKAMISRTKKSKNSKWILDSGCTKHMANCREFFCEFKPESGTIQVGNNEFIRSEGIGTVKVATVVRGVKKIVVLTDVLLVPEIAYNLISISQARRNGHRIIIDGRRNQNQRGVLELFNKKSGDVKMIGIETKEGLYEAALKVRLEKAHTAVCAKEKPWHERMGHCGKETLIRSLPHIDGINEGEINIDDEFCRPCVLSKSTRAPRKTNKNKIKTTTRAVERIHTDVVGPIKVKSLGRAKYFVTALDDHSGYALVRFVNLKNEVAEAIIEMIREIENLFNFKTQNLMSVSRNIVKWVKSDGGGEYVGHKLQNWLKQKGIVHEVTTPYSPESNGSAERLNRTLMDMARTLIWGMETPRKELWAEAVNTACYIRNRLISASCKEKCTPYEVLRGKKPNVSHFKIFGSKAYVHKPNIRRDGKFDSRSEEGILVGYCSGNGYRILLNESKRIIESRDVTFDETNIAKGNQLVSEMVEFDMEEDTEICDLIDDEYELGKYNNIGDIGIENNQENESSGDENIHLGITTHENVEENLNNSSVELDMDALTYIPAQREERRSKRTNIGNKPPRFGYDEMYFAQQNIKLDEDIPTTFEEAMEGRNKENWLEAMRFEISSLESLKTWDLMELPDDRNVIQTKWVFDIKRNGKGEIERYKARLVAKGFSQIPGIDFVEVFSPVSRYSTIRFGFALAIYFNWKRELIDVKNAFVNAELSEEIYINQPKGFVDNNHPDHVFKLNKALYGLKQASREWNAHLNRYLVKYGFVESRADQTLYWKKDEKSFIILVIYVDDILIFSNNQSQIDEEIDNFSKEFEIRRSKSIDKFLGITIEDEGDQVRMHNEPMIIRMLKYFNMENSKPTGTPLPSNLDLEDNGSSPLPDQTPFRQIVGSLMHLANTVRPDISYSVNFLARYMHRPTDALWTACKHMLRYLKGTARLGLHFQSGGDLKMLAFSDSDWAQERPSRKSVSGNVILFAGGPVSWKSKRQSVVAQSTKEAEFIALSTCIRELLWFKKFGNMLERIISKKKVDQLFNVSIAEDNQACIREAKNPGSSELSKHIDVKFQFLVDNIQKGIVDIHYVPTENMAADLFTKNLKRIRFEKLRDSINME